MMNRNLQINELQISDAPHRQRQTPKSQPASPKKIQLKKTISAMSQDPNPPKLWHQSSLSLTRQQAPAHKIPKSLRFRSRDDDTLRNRQYMTLQIGRDIKSDRGIRFAKSHRPEHFVKGLGELGPSPASYNNSTSQADWNHSTRTISNFNPEATSEDVSQLKWTIKGRSFFNFSNHQKSYLPHAKHLFYQPENVLGQPGPGQYNHSWVAKPKKESYSIRAVLKRFNQTSNGTPGPGAYGQVNSERVSSPNAKGTIPKSRRTYLTKFQNNPSPMHYRITRFLQK